MAASDESELIANESDLETFGKASAEQRQLTAGLKGVLAETACTGKQLQLPLTLSCHTPACSEKALATPVQRLTQCLLLACRGYPLQVAVDPAAASAADAAAAARV
jgi:hypothetical protein